MANCAKTRRLSDLWLTALRQPGAPANPAVLDKRLTPQLIFEFFGGFGEKFGVD